MSMNYEEESILTEYIWNNYRHLLSPFDLRVEKADLLRKKSLPPVQERMVTRMWGETSSPDVEEALKDGFDAYQRAAVRRILRGHVNEVFINRCPRCNRVVRTPRARQCLWCHHRWHKR